MLSTSMRSTVVSRSGVVAMQAVVRLAATEAAPALRRFSTTSQQHTHTRVHPLSSVTLLRRASPSIYSSCSAASSSSLLLHSSRRFPSSVRLFSAAPSSSSNSTRDPPLSSSSTSTPSSSHDAPSPAVTSTRADGVVIPALSPVETWGTKSTRVWGKVKAEAKHYWLGTKLLWAEVRIAAKLCRQIANGHEMSRRERKQLLRTCADLVRMVPFVVILVVPFAEFALPVLLKFFPNMLPSTYLDSTGAEAKLQKQLLVKMEMARFLQETTHLLAQQLASQKGMSNEEALRSAEKFRDFMDKVRTGKKVLNADIIGFSKLFDSELTLDNLDQKQLEAMCRLLDIKVFGSLWVLRYKLEEKLRRIQKDDELIQKDGIEALNYAELQEACRARGIYTDQDEAYLRRKLGDWLELSLEKEVPITLLLLSRAFSRQMTGHHDMAEDLASTLAYVPAVAVAEAEKEIVDRTDDKAAKLKVLHDEAVEAAFEELQMSKAGAGGEHRAAKLRTTKPAIGVTKEKLARLEERNDDVEELIDETIAEDEELESKKKSAAAAGEKQAGEEKAAAAAAKTAAATVPAAAPTAAATPVASVSQPVRTETVTLFDASPTKPAAKPATAAAVAAPVAAVETDAVLPPAADDVTAAPAAAASPAASAAAASKVDEEAAAQQKSIAKKKKQIQVVDKLNDRVGKIIDEIKAQAEVLEKAENEKDRK